MSSEKSKRRRSSSRKTGNMTSRPFVILMAVIGIAIAGAVVVSKVLTPDAEDHLASAREYAAENSLEEAMIETRNALALEPEFAKARAFYGDLLVRNGQLRRAKEEFDRAQVLGFFELNPEEGKGYNIAYLEALIGSAAYEQAAKRFEQTPESERNRRWRELETRFLVGTGELDAATNRLRELVAEDPDDRLARLALVEVLVAGENYEEAREELQIVVRTNPDDPTNQLLLGDIEFGLENHNAAQKAYSSALSSDERYHAQAHTGLAKSYVAQKQFNKARQHIDALLQKWPSTPGAHYLDALKARIDNDYLRAKKRVDLALGFAPKDTRVLMLAAEINTRLGDFAAAEELLNTILKQRPEHHQASLLLAQVELTLERPKDAFARLRNLEPFLPGEPRLRAMLAQAKASLDAQTSGSAAAALAGASSDVQSGVDSNLNGDISEEDRLLSRALALLRTDQDEQAMQILDEAILAKPDYAPFHNFRGFILETSLQNAESRSSYEKALALDGDFVPAIFNLARLDERAGELEAARQSLERALSLQPANVATLRALARVEFTMNRLPRAIKYLEQIIAIRGDALKPRIGLAEIYRMKGDYARAQGYAESALEIAPDHLVVLEVAAKSALAQGDGKTAIGHLKRALDLAPSSVALKAMAAQADAQLGDRDSAAQRLEEVLSAAPNLHTSRALLARVRLEQGRFQEVLEQGRILRERLPQSGEGDFLQAQAHSALGDKDAALNSFRAAFDLEPSARNVLNLSTALLRNKDPRGAASVLDPWLNENPENTQVLMRRASVHLTLGEQAQAISTYKKIIKLDPASVVALNNLANLYQESDLDEAIRFAEQAFASSPESAAVLDTLGWLLTQKGELSRAVPLLRQAHERQATPTHTFHLATAIAQTGAETEAKSLLQPLLQTNAKFRKRDQAQALLDRLQ